ncbi:MAG: hypothetical protein J6C78_09895 [Muribaculaceae bacterium]|nr:hypothetical protein [Muribaculaceae bacterium]
MSSSNRPRIIAAVATLLIVTAVVLLLLSLYLRYTGDEPRKWPPEDTSELLLDGEYVKLGDIPQPQKVDVKKSAPSKQQAAPPADDLVDAGEPAPEPAPIVANTKQESPMKVKDKPKPEKTGPTKAELAEREKARKQQEAADKIANRVKFSGTGSGKSESGKSGSANGNSNSGALKGAPGTNLKGRTLSSWSKPSGTATGSITIQVRVNRQGHVIKATYLSGSGPIASSAAARQSCEQAAMASRFSVDLDAVAEQVGSITYRFE